MKVSLFVIATLFVASSFQDQLTPIWKNNLLTTIPHWGKEFQVSFEIRPLSISNKISNILHFSNGGDCCNAGNRIPSVWFIAKTFRLTISSSLNGNNNYHVDVKNALPMNKFTRVVIQQFRDNKGVYKYKIIIGGKTVKEIVNSKPQNFKNVKVYAANPWSITADCVLRDFKYTVEPEFKGNLVRGRKLKDIGLWGREWRMSFKVKPLSAQKPWTSIIHLTTGKDAGAPGTRIPSVMFYPNTKRLTVFTQLGANNAWSYTTPKDLPIIKYTNVHIEQVMDRHGKFYFKIIIDGKKVVSQLQSKPTNYKGVMLYLSNPWYAHADAYVRDIHLEAISGSHYYTTV